MRVAPVENNVPDLTSVLPFVLIAAHFAARRILSSIRSVVRALKSKTKVSPLRPVQTAVTIKPRARPSR